MLNSLYILPILVLMTFKLSILAFIPKNNRNNAVNRVNKEPNSKGTFQNLYQNPESQRNTNDYNNLLKENAFKYSVEKEIVNGRLAMFGLAAGIGREYLTGEDLWTQVGIIDKNLQDSILLFLFGVVIVGVSSKLASLKDTAMG